MQTVQNISQSLVSMEERQRSFFAQEGVDPLAYAFSKKMAVHPGSGGGHLLSGRELEQAVSALLQHTREKDSAIYIHVPFCESKCLYCGFYRKAYRDGESKIFSGSLLREMEAWSRYPVAQSTPVHAVYFGGGTPSSLDPMDLRVLLSTVRSNFILANDCEITVEGRIHNFDADKIKACLDGGANRFSIGVQTFHTELRRSMGRIADRESIIRSLQTFKAFNNAVVVIDLIFGFPGQTMEMWQKDIETFLELELDGVDLYQLNVFKGSLLEKKIAQGDFPAAADLPTQSRLFAEGVKIMEKARYRRLSISHWGRTTRERNLYNHLMKGPAEAIAFGPGAGGYLDNYFYFIEPDYQKWLDKIAGDEKAVAMMMSPAPQADLDKTITAGFDLGRLNLEQMQKVSDRPIGPLIETILHQWERAGLIRIDGTWLELTLAGQFWHVNLAQLLIKWIHQSIQISQ